MKNKVSLILRHAFALLLCLLAAQSARAGGLTPPKVDATTETSTLDDLLSYGKVRIKTRRSNGYYITNTSTTGNNLYMRASIASTSEDYGSQVWIIEKHGTTYSLRNYKTGLYLSYKSASSEVKNFTIAYNADNTSSQEYVNIYESIASTKGAVHYQTSGDIVVEWGAEGGEGSDWTFEKVDIDDATVRARFDEMDGRLSAVSTTDWLIIRNSNGNVLSENTSTKKEEVNARDDSNYAQLWKLVPVEGSEGYYQIVNGLTQRYVAFASFNAQHSATTVATKGGFKVQSNTDYSRFVSAWEMHPATDESHVLHRSGNRLLTWNAYDGNSNTEGSVWFFEKASVTDEEMTAAQKSFTEASTELSSVSKYKKALATFFDDDLCTELKDEYKSSTDDELKAAMAEAGIASETLQNMAVKVKNNSWDKWEKVFRVRDIEPYSDPGTWNDILKIGYVYTKLSNPTGIWAPTNGLVYIFIGSAIPSGCTMQLHKVSQTDSQGEAVALKKGLNILQVGKEAALYISYTVPTTATSKKVMADYANIPVHIEGGEVDGYFDATREGIDTDEAWKEMVKDGLFSKSIAMMKGRNIIYQLNCSLTKQYIPEKMREIVDFWDWMVDVEHSLMAVNEYKDRWRNVLGFYSCTYNYMFATSYGTYYNESTLSEVLDYDKMAAGGGSLWGPAHENGHIHQNLINMIGTTEISNNLFSQVVVHQNGKTSTRLNSTKFKDVATSYAEGQSWHDYNLWVRNTMFFKLYLYYQVEGYKPDFYPALFRALRKDPMSRVKGSESNPTPASKDFLKFAVKCCEVSGDDLSEFFRAFGFFVPFETRMIDDYGNFYTYCTQEMIDDALAEMHKYPKPKGNILFIENHVKHEPATDHDGNFLYNEDGSQVLRTDYNDEDAVGKCGDVGSYSDYEPGKYADGYTYTKSGYTITMKGSGAVGFKVYDEDDNLIYFANTNKFTIPTVAAKKLKGKTTVVKAAQADGTDIVVPGPGVKTFTLKVYRANSVADDKSATVYTDGSEAMIPVLDDNALAFIQPTQNELPETLVNAQNVVNAATATAHSVALTDAADFYTPSAFTTETLTYSSDNTAGWTALSVPFALSVSDFGAHHRLETFTGAQAGSDGTTELHFFATDAEQPAGTPCLVYSPEDETGWTLTKSNVAVSADPASATADCVTLSGTFTAKSLTAGSFLLNAEGDKFAATADSDKAAAFRFYVTAADAASAPAAYTVVHGGTDGIGSVTALTGTDGAKAVYDLSGRRVAKPQTGGVYIVGGKKVVF